MAEWRILLIEDEESIYELFDYNLKKEGFCLYWAKDGPEGLEMYQKIKPDLILLDLMLPKVDGLEVCRRLQREDNPVPIIMLTAKNEEIDRVLGLELGADDYITKPFSIREVIARIKAVLRRSQAPACTEEQLQRGRLKLKPKEYTASYQNVPLTLTPKEFSLLYFLARKAGQVVTREDALSTVWEYDYPGDTRTVDVHIRQLRQKLAVICPGESPIDTIRGIGYRWREK